MTTNYNINNVDLDSTYDFSSYINVSDANYTNLSQLAITARKSVMFGQQTSTYAYLNVGSAFNVAQNINVPKVDIDPTTITAVYPQGVIFTDTTNSQTYFRGNFALLENCPNTFLSLNTPTTYFYSPVQIGYESNWTNVSAGKNGGLLTKKNTSTQLTRTSGDWIYGFGFNVNGVFPSGGISSTYGFYSPTPMYVPGPWKDFEVSKSDSMWLALQSNGTLWGCGYNNNGQLGTPDNLARSSPTQIGNLSSWVKLATGQQCHYAIQSNGTLWGIGTNNQGQLGQGNLTNTRSLVQIGSASNWAQISAGRGWIYGIQSNGTLWAWGSSSAPIGGNRSTEAQVGSSLWKQISTNAGFTTPPPLALGIQTDGSLWAVGGNSYGQLGINSVTGSYTTFVQVGSSYDWAQISCGYSHWTAIKTNGTLWACGNNTQGQLAINSSTLAVSSPIQIGSLSNWAKVSSCFINLAIQSNGTLWAWGPSIPKYDDYTQPNKIIYGI
jgi:alpha-tubulin suppressor-like RCC1 family protein